MPISPEMLTILTRGTGMFITLVRVTARASQGGDVLAYALHTRPVVYDSTTFLPAPFEPSKMSQSAGVNVDNATINHLLGEMFTKMRVQARKWSGARVELIAVDLLNLSAGPAKQHFGRVGDITTAGPSATTEFRGLMQLLNQELGDRTSKLCRYKLGDGDCTLSLAPFTVPTTVVMVHNNQRITVTEERPDSYFKYGKAEFTSGLNSGLDVEVIDNVGEMVTLFLPMPYEIMIGDDLDLIAGDDKSLFTCHNKFNNAINHGGEDCMPVRERIFKFPEL